MRDFGSGSYELDLLRVWQLRRDGVVLRVANRQQRLIAALAIRGPSLRSCLAGLLWPEVLDAKALESLRVSLHLVSRQAPGLIVNGGATLSLDTQVEIDLHQARGWMKAASEDGWNKDLPSLIELRDADLLPGWYDDWVLMDQDRLRQDRLRVFTAISRVALNKGDCAVACAAAEAALEIEPLYETAARVLFNAQLQHGNEAAALKCYERYRSRLEKQMGIQPSLAFRGLVENAVEHDSRLRQGSLSPIAEFPLVV